MLNAAPLTAFHVEQLIEAGAGEARTLRDERRLAALVAPPNAALALLDDERTIAALGMVEMWLGRASVWALFTPACGPFMVTVTRLVRRIMELSPYNRIEGYSYANYAASIRWHELLGFACEGVAQRFTPDDQPAVLFAWTRGGAWKP
jgi:hypothetical protein